MDSIFFFGKEAFHHIKWNWQENIQNWIKIKCCPEYIERNKQEKISIFQELLLFVGCCVAIWWGVRLRSRLSPEGGRNQKWHFKAKTGTFFIHSYKLGAYYVKSYKKWTKRLNIFKSLNLQWGLGLKYRDFDRNLYFSSNCNFVVIFIS